jgi:CrcB protein
MNWQWWLLVAAGGAAGSLLRGAAAWVCQSARLQFPWATLGVNFFGSLFIGWLMGSLPALDAPAAARWHAVLITGFCGGFTTFSTFSWQTFEQFNRGHTGTALANIAANLLLCLFAVWLGFRLSRG